MSQTSSPGRHREAPRPLTRHQFASDNYSGICPEAWDAMALANQGHAQAYGNDVWTYEAAELLRELFETDCEVFFTFNGTSANSLALAAICQSYHGIVCHQLAHIETDECGAPEFFSNGTKLLTIPGDEGRIDPAAVVDTVVRRTDIHYPMPRVMSITQSTEMGTVYSVEHLKALQAIKTIDTSVGTINLRLHMDGARFSNAVASLGVTPKEVTWQVGVDVLCFGGTKNGMAVGEAIIFFNKELAAEFDHRCKQAGQLASKMRFLAAPWVGILKSKAWLRNAKHANAMAARLEEGLATKAGLKLDARRQANACFVTLPEKVRDGLRARGWVFYTFIGVGGCRFMTSWDTTDADVDALVGDITQLM